MSCMLVTVDTSHVARSPLKDDAEANIAHMVVKLDTSHLEMSPLNDDAEKNIPRMLVTLDTSHLEISPVNRFAPRTVSRLNNMLMSVTAEISQVPIGPCGPSEQSVDSCCRHFLMAAWSCTSANGYDYRDLRC